MPGMNPNPMRTPFVLLLFFALVLDGCFTTRIPPVSEYPAIENQSIFLVKKIEYDRFGRPRFDDRLSMRPSSSGEAFTVVHAINNRPVRSYDIAIVGSKADLTKPFAVIYDWTGRGFEGGAEISSGLFPQGATIQSGEEAAVYLAIKAAPIVVATVTGFVVGVLASIPETAIELKKVIVNAHETVIGRREYIYDERGRIKFMNLYPPPEHSEALVKTQFIYDGGGETPVRTEVISVAERKVRTIP